METLKKTAQSFRISNPFHHHRSVNSESDMRNHVSKDYLTDHSRFLRAFLNAAYFFSISPFRLQLQENCNGRPEYVAKSWLLQKVLGACVSILGFGWVIRELRMCLPRSTDFHNPVKYFNVLLAIFGTLYQVETVRILWTRRNLFLKIANCQISLIITSKTAPIFYYLFFGKIGITVSWALYTGTAITHWLTVQGFVEEIIKSPSVNNDRNHIFNWSFHWWWRSLVEAGKFNFFLQNFEDAKTNDPSRNTFSTWENLIGTVSAIGLLQRQIIEAYCDFFLMMFVYTLWSSVYNFAYALRVNNLEHFPAELNNALGTVVVSTSDMNQVCLPWSMVRKNYNKLKMLADLINEAIGTNVTYLLVSAVLYYAIYFNIIFAEKENLDWTKLVGVLLYFLNACLIFNFSSNICYQVIRY